MRSVVHHLRLHFATEASKAFCTSKFRTYPTGVGRICTKSATDRTCRPSVFGAPPENHVEVECWAHPQERAPVFTLSSFEEIFRGVDSIIDSLSEALPFWVNQFPNSAQIARTFF